KDYISVGAGFKPAPTSPSSGIPAILNARRYRTNLIKALHLGLAAVLLFCATAAFATDGDLTHFRLPNGLAVFVKEDHSRKVAAVQMWVMVGAAYENDSERGISHVIEHMAFKGTKKRGVGRIAEEVEEIGGQINAYTVWDETVFHIVVPSSAASQGLDIITDAVFRSVINPKELEKEKKVVLEEILEDQDRPEDVAFNKLFETAYIRSPYRFPVIGQKEIVEKITRKNILDFRKKWYVPENMFLMVVGDVDPAAVRRDVERFTSDVKPTAYLNVSLPQEPPQTQIRSALTRDSNATETRLDIAYHIPSMKGNDVNKLDLTADILGGRDNSRLVRILKQEKALVNSISAESYTPKRPGMMMISATLDSKNLEAATTTIMEELARLAGTSPPADELAEAKIHIESQHIYDRETVQGIAKSMGQYQNWLEDADYEEKYLALNSGVTPEQISTAVKQYLMPPNVTVTVLLPKDEAKDFRIEQLEKIVGGFKPVAKVPGVKAGHPETVLRELPNGIKMVLVPDSSNPVISFRIACLGGKRFETMDTQGIMNFISRMLNKGAGNMTDLDIARKVDEMGGSLDGFSGNDSFGLYASFFSRYWDQALDLLFQLYADPTFPQDKLDRERSLIMNDIKTEPDTPTEYVINILNKTLFPKFPYGFDKLGSEASVAGFTQEDLRQTYQRFAVPSNTVIAVVGEMDTQKVGDKIAQLFGGIQAAAFESPEIPTEEPLEKVRENIMHVPRAKAHLAVGFRATTFSAPDRFPLDVLNNILTGQGGRLFRRLRDEESLAYTVVSFSRPAMSPGVFGFYMACDAPKADRAYEGLVGQIEQIKKAQVSDAELQKAIKNLVGNHLISLQSSSDRAESIGLYTLYGLGYDYDPIYISKIREVTAEDVLRVARKYLDLEHCAVVKVLPEEEKK
ncbi:MAG: insulinase family protein, partial [Bacteroidetes bacterium]|nr:insulinase family protein [Bacteroidota bacterium]